MALVPLHTEKITNDKTAAYTLVATAFAVAVDDVIVVKCVSEDSSGTTIQTPTDSLLNTYALRPSSLVGSNCGAKIYTSVITTAGSLTISGHATGGRSSICVEQWRDAKLAATPAIVSLTGSGLPSASITTTGIGSAVSWAKGDWAAKTGTRTYRSSAVEEADDFFTGIYTADYAYQAAPAAGAQTIGQTTPTAQTWVLVGIEIQDNSAPPASNGLLLMF